MKTVYPDYYKSFRCIAEKCTHSCCVGWEIDIDSKSLDSYGRVTGSLGKRLQSSISLEDTPHFILDRNERCPFLNCQGLCDIYISLGEKSLCDICREHPRFYNEFQNTVETGLGLCCEEAARLIITKPEPVKLSGVSEASPQALLSLRNHALEIIQSRALSIPQRLERLMQLFDMELREFDIPSYAKLFYSLERLDERWSYLLRLLIKGFTPQEEKRFDLFMQNRQTEYEQLLHYLIYRHLIKGKDFKEAGIYAVFACLGYSLIHGLGVAIFSRKSDFTVADQLEAVRLFSSEIEYSDENLQLLLDYLEDELNRHNNS